MEKVELASKMVGAAPKIYEILKACKIVSQEITVRVPESIGSYSLAIDIQQGRPVSRKIKFPFQLVKRVQAHSLPMFAPQDQAVVRVHDGFELAVDRLSKDCEILLLTFEYKIEDPRFLENIVQKNVQVDTVGEEKNEYWMHAQLKHLAALQTIYGGLDLRDIDVLVNVCVHQDIKTKIPQTFIRNLEVIKRLVQTRDRVEKWRLAQEHLRLGRAKYVHDPYQVLSDLQELFFPRTFAKFVEVANPFYYSDCIRGTDFYELPFPTFPRIMTVISRTDLSFKTPAADGKLIYKKRVFQQEVSKIFG